MAISIMDPVILNGLSVNGEQIVYLGKVYRWGLCLIGHVLFKMGVRGIRGIELEKTIFLLLCFPLFISLRSSVSTFEEVIRDPYLFLF